ncbi:MAG: hypothetical protein JNL50_02340, partial [Phycisphaerae bacterium]|nr:hypothetical protein [Phycisphaerae bacterium]
MEATPAIPSAMIARTTDRAVSPCRLAAMISLAVAMTAGSSAALGQYYRGGSNGNLLQRNLQRGGGGGGGQTRDDLGRSMLSFRNSVIYGNAGGGLAFQGSIPYTAPGEFRGKLQSDALYAFRRDSFYSSVANSGVRSGDALSYRRSLTIGGQRPQGVEGSLSVPRGGSSRPFNPTSVASPTQGSLGRSSSSTPIPSLGGGGMLRRSAAGASSTSQGTLNQLKANALQNATGVSTRSGLYAQDDFNLTGDNLRSRMTNYVPELSAPDQLTGERSLKAADAMRQRTERVGAAASKPQGPGDASPTPAGPARLETGVQPASAAGKRDTTNTTYDELRERFEKLLPSKPGETRPGAQPAGAALSGAAPAGPSNAMRDFQRQIIDLSSDLRNDSARVRASATSRSRLSQGLATANPESPESTRPFERIELGPDGQRLPKDERLGPTIDPGTLRIIRSAGAQVDTFIPGGAAKRDIYGENMAAGQQALGEGRYFDAEERFARAGSMRRGDTTSAVGILHAQIGSGMVLSAGATLRNLLTEHPEMTAMRYAENLRPSAARTGEIVERLRFNVSSSGRLRRDSGLLLAYIGFQSQDKAMTAEGLDAVAKADAAELAINP